MSRSKNSGSRLGRFPAAEECKKRGWGVGTTISSVRWSSPMVVKRIVPPFVFLYGAKGSQQAKTLPEDVKEVVRAD